MGLKSRVCSNSTGITARLSVTKGWRCGWRAVTFINAKPPSLQAASPRWAKASSQHRAAVQRRAPCRLCHTATSLPAFLLLQCPTSLPQKPQAHTAHPWACSSLTPFISWTTLHTGDDSHHWKIGAFPGFWEPSCFNLSQLRCCFAAGPQLKLWPCPDGPAGGNAVPSQQRSQSRNCENTEWLKSNPPMQTAGCSSQGLSPASPVLCLQDTAPVPWQGVEEPRHVTGSTELLTEPGAWADDWDPPPRNPYTAPIPICPVKWAWWRHPGEQKAFWLEKSKRTDWGDRLHRQWEAFMVKRSKVRFERQRGWAWTWWGKYSFEEEGKEMVE